MLKNNLMFYIKTTETCNLNCKHCFTNGRLGKKIFFNPDNTARWVNSLKEKRPFLNAHFEFHGGEPMLADLKDLYKFYNLVSVEWNNASFGITTNLVYKLTEDKIKFFKNVCNSRIGTSWDPYIRFENDNQLKLFKDNIKTLLENNITIKMFVSLSNDVVDLGAEKLLDIIEEFKIHELALERITDNGSATKNNVKPSNLKLQNFFLDMHNIKKEYSFFNEFMDTIYAKFENNDKGLGTFCRDCEQKIFTINATGTIGGCPNSAQEDFYSHINNNIDDVLKSEKRCNIIMKEMTRDNRCFNCSVFKYCGGDCHQLDWEGDLCASPRFLMKKLKEEYAVVN